jgi:hypothetical protein
MERLQELITQLKEQFERKAEPSQMLQTTRLLDAELQRLAGQQAVAGRASAKVAVMMPSSMKIYTGQSAVQEMRAAAPEQRIAAPEQRIAAPEQRNGTPEIRSFPPATAPVAAPAASIATIAREKEPERGAWPFDPLAERPADRPLPVQSAQHPLELNDVIGKNGSSSLNDKLKSDVLELKSALNDTPVRDLKKAIGVNDRYVFINQLFRGDEVMYERSLKTINGFRILPEAEYWMERELKVKLGWDENREATRQFYQLVKRRFS